MCGAEKFICGATAALSNRLIIARRRNARSANTGPSLMPCEDAKDKIMHQVMRLVAQGLARGRLKMEVAGLHHVPACGPAILVARHYHHLFDGVALHWAIARRIHIFVTIDWATDPCTRFFME